MLYVTTRNNVDVFTAHRVLTHKRGPDGGLFLPYRVPTFSQEEIYALAKNNFNANLADTLNLLFGSHLSSYDIDLALGRHCVRLNQLGQKLIIGECWHNTDWHIGRMICDIAKLVSPDESALEVNGWVQIGVRVAILFGIFGELIREGLADSENTVDVALTSGNFAGPMSAWYARTMGLPIGNIVCCCNENATLWDFICHGVLRTDGIATKTIVSEADVVIPEYIEHLICLYGGPDEIERYVQTLHRGGSYYVDDGLLNRLRQGLYITVSSEKRVLNTIPNVLSTHHYLLSKHGALAYSGLLDYRARTGVMRTSLILTEKSPTLDFDTDGADIIYQKGSKN